jgi:hypothetical protein
MKSFNCAEFIGDYRTTKITIFRLRDCVFGPLVFPPSFSFFRKFWVPPVRISLLRESLGSSRFRLGPWLCGRRRPCFCADFIARHDFCSSEPICRRAVPREESSEAGRLAAARGALARVRVRRRSAARERQRRSSTAGEAWWRGLPPLRANVPWSLSRCRSVWEISARLTDDCSIRPLS